MASSVCTPTKTFERVDVSPNSKNTLCLQCGKYINDVDKRRRLFSGSKKTNVCENIERIIGRILCTETTLTNVVCRSCGDKNAALVKKVTSVKEQFASVASTIVKDHGKSCTKRQHSQAEGHSDEQSNQYSSKNNVKRRVLFSTTELNSQPSNESEQVTEAISVREGDSSVSVSFSPFNILYFHFNIRK